MASKGTEREVNVVLGPPGTGKTYRLLGEIDRLLDRHMAPERIAFVSFTRAAVQEARARAAQRFSLQEETMQHFRTLHATAFHALGLSRGDIMPPEAYAEIAESVGLRLRGRYAEDGGQFATAGGDLGDAALRIFALAKARGTTYEQEWRQAPERELRWDTVQDFIGALELYKKDTGLLDFTDLLELCTTSLPVDAFILDEAQDLSPAQWALSRRLAKHAKLVWIAGDDDQAIYDFAGAAGNHLLRLPSTSSVVLPQSYRLPQAIKSFADRVSAHILRRIPKTFLPRPELGAVHWISDPEELELRGPETWLLLARHQHQLDTWRRLARRQGVVYRWQGRWSNQLPVVRAAVLYERLRRGQSVSVEDLKIVRRYCPTLTVNEEADAENWQAAGLPGGERAPWFDALTMDVEDREYIRAFLSCQEPVNGPGRVIIDTIHAVKGKEADHVALLTDVTTKVLETLGHPVLADTEWRVWYVGATRARLGLWLVVPQTDRFWPGP